MASISPLRQPLEGQTRAGVRVRLRPAPSAGRWLADVWDAQGALVVAGRPVAVGCDLFSVSRDLGSLTFSGAADPSAEASLDTQGVGVTAG